MFTSRPLCVCVCMCQREHGHSTDMMCLKKKKKEKEKKKQNPALTILRPGPQELFPHIRFSVCLHLITPDHKDRVSQHTPVSFIKFIGSIIDPL